MKRFAATVLRRESALHLLADHEPVHHDGCDVLWRGHIRNAACIRRALGTRAATADSDGALIAAAYRAWGTQFVEELDGAFSVLLLDRHAARCVLAHDELGLSPLFYAFEDDQLHVGSHLEDLVQHLPERALDEEFIADYLAQCWHLGPRTPFAGIARLQPGEVLTWDAGGSLLRATHWSYARPKPEKLASAADYAARLREIIVEVTGESIPKGGRNACELSGGLDSSTVLCAGLEYGAKLDAVSFTYPRSREGDERRWIRAVIERGDTKWHALDGDSCPPFSGELSDFQAEPSLALLSAARLEAYDALLERERITTVLTGIGGDCVFYGDSPSPTHFADLLRRGRFATLARAIEDWRAEASEMRPFAYWLAKHAIKPWLAWRRGRQISFETTEAEWLDRSYAAQIGLGGRGRDNLLPREEEVASALTFESLHRAAYAISLRYQRTALPAEFRHPLLARPLIRFMLAVPPELRFSAGCDRLLQRHAIRGMVPDEIVLRRGKGGPDQAVYRGLRESSHWQRKLCEDPKVVSRGYVDRERWREAVQRAAAGYAGPLRIFQATASLEAWLQQLDRGRARDREPKRWCFSSDELK